MSQRTAHLCAGAVGIAADHLLGHRTIALSEINKYAVKLSETRYPGAEQLGNLELITPEQILRLKLDRLCAGWPCTSLSRLGKQEGMTEGSGTPSALIWPILGIIAGCVAAKKPIPELFLENVEDVLESPDFPLLIERLKLHGYRFAYGVNTCDRHVFLPDGEAFSFPHKRPRFWLLARHGAGNNPGEIVFPEHDNLTNGKNWTTCTTRARGAREFRRRATRRDGSPSKTANRLRDDLETQTFIEHELRHGEGTSKGLRMDPTFVEKMMGVPLGFTNLSIGGTVDFGMVDGPLILEGRGVSGNTDLLDDPSGISHFVERHAILGNGQNVWQLMSAYRHLDKVLQ